MMEDQEDVTVLNSSLTEDSFEIRSTEIEPLNQSNFNVPEYIEVASTEDSIICIDEDDGSIMNDVPLNLSSTSLPVTIPFTSGDLESSSINQSNDDDDFCIVYEKKASPSEVQILENYISPNTQTKKKQKSQNPRPSNQYYNSAAEYANLSLDDSILIVEGLHQPVATPTESQHNVLNRLQQPVATPTESQHNVLNRLQQLAADSTEKKKRKIECGVCFDGPDEIEASERTLVSTNCGHIFCSDCIKLAIKNCKHCPQCRKKLTMKQFHALYV